MPNYIQDPNDSTKLVPVAQNTVLVREARVPAQLVINKRPDYILVNNTGSYAFLYDTTGSLGGTSHYLANNANETFVTGSVLNVVSTGSGSIAEINSGKILVNPVKLDINPVAWRRTDGGLTAGLVGDVTFVFQGTYKNNAGPK